MGNYWEEQMTIRSGSKGALVTRLQQALKDRDLYSIEVDGTFGPATEDAVKALQLSEGLPTDGIAGSEVFRALGMPNIAEELKWKTTGSSRPFRAVSFAELATRKEPTSRNAKKESTERNQVFISYSHKDKKRWLDRLHVHLKPLMQQGGVTLWDDSLIKPGEKWREAIKKGLASAKVAILLVSADFLASDFITAEELPALLAAAKSEGTLILPLIVSPCRFLKTESLSQFQAVNLPSQPLSEMTKARQEATFVKLIESVEDALKS
jgi:hypothetical protein